MNSRTERKICDVIFLIKISMFNGSRYAHRPISRARGTRKKTHSEITFSGCVFCNMAEFRGRCACPQTEVIFQAHHSSRRAMMTLMQTAYFL